MKPVKNWYFCKDCGKSKILFETEKKTLNFIKFNAAEIEESSGYKPERAYYCMYCNGWHVTHVKKEFGILSKTEIILARYRYEKKKNP